MEGEVAVDHVKASLDPEKPVLAWIPSTLLSPGLPQPPVMFLQQDGLAHRGQGP